MARSSWILATAVNAIVGFFAYAVGFMSSYFMNDSPEWDDQIWFAKCGVAAASVSAAAVAVMICRYERLVSRRAVVFAVTASVALNATFLAIFFGSQAENLGSDPEYFYGAMTVGEVYILAGVCAAVAILAGAAAILATHRPQLETEHAHA